MTNAERFIGDEDEIDTFIEEVADFFVKEEGFYNKEYIKNVLIDFFKQSVIPALTEDERVILRNMEFKDYNIIGRKESGDLYVNYKENDSFNGVLLIMFKKHLFQFIKERRRI